MSPPTRGAWIEILNSYQLPIKSWSRPPHGGRGLKYHKVNGLYDIENVAPHTGGVD